MGNGANHLPFWNGCLVTLGKKETWTEGFDNGLLD